MHALTAISPTQPNTLLTPPFHLPEDVMVSQLRNTLFMELHIISLLSPVSGSFDVLNHFTVFSILIVVKSSDSQSGDRGPWGPIWNTLFQFYMLANGYSKSADLQAHKVPHIVI